VYQRSLRCTHIEFVLPRGRELLRRAEAARISLVRLTAGAGRAISDVLDGVVAMRWRRVARHLPGRQHSSQ